MLPEELLNKFNKLDLVALVISLWSKIDSVSTGLFDELGKMREEFCQMETRPERHIKSERSIIEVTTNYWKTMLDRCPKIQEKVPWDLWHSNISQWQRILLPSLIMLDKQQKQVCRRAGPSLASSLKPLAQDKIVASLSISIHITFRCLFQLTELVLLLYPIWKFTGYTNRLYDFSVIISKKCLTLDYDLTGLNFS